MSAALDWLLWGTGLLFWTVAVAGVVVGSIAGLFRTRRPAGSGRARR